MTNPTHNKPWVCLSRVRYGTLKLKSLEVNCEKVSYKDTLIILEKYNSNVGLETDKILCFKTALLVWYADIQTDKYSDVYILEAL